MNTVTRIFRGGKFSRSGAIRDRSHRLRAGGATDDPATWGWCVANSSWSGRPRKDVHQPHDLERVLREIDRTLLLIGGGQPGRPRFSWRNSNRFG